MCRSTGSQTARGLATAATIVTLAAAPHLVTLDAWKAARPDYVWRFPEDHWSHDGYKTEWWYFTGHLTVRGAVEPRFGYQFTFFRIGLVPEAPDLASSWSAKDLIMGHAAITDLTTGQHLFSEVVRRAAPMLGGFGRYPDPVLAWSLAPTGSPGRWTLEWNGTAFDFSARDEHSGFGFALVTVPAKPHIFQGPNGFSRKGDGPTAASQYYSFTRLETGGTITIGADTFAVAGVSWMDKEFGSNQLGRDQAGWDWFSLQLDDGRDIMLYLLRHRDGSVDFARGTLVGTDGSTRFITAAEWTVRTTGRWTSPETGGVYPAGWTISVPAAGVTLTVEPLLDDQENVSRLIAGLDYWEGAVRIRNPDGRIIGRGYVELAGYVEQSTLPI